MASILSQGKNSSLLFLAAWVCPKMRDNHREYDFLRLNICVVPYFGAHSLYPHPVHILVRFVVAFCLVLSYIFAKQLKWLRFQTAPHFWSDFVRFHHFFTIFFQIAFSRLSHHETPPLFAYVPMDWWGENFYRV